MASVESIFELGQIAKHMLGTDGVVGAPDAVLDVSDGRVDPFEGGNPNGLRLTSRDHGAMAATRLRDGREAAEAVADQGGATRQQTRAQFLDFGLSEALDGPDFEALRAAVGGGFHRHHNGRLARRDAPPLAAMASAAEIAVIHLDTHVGSADGRLRFAFQHQLAQLVLHRPGGCLSDPEAARQFQAGDALLRLRDQIDRLEPVAQRQIGGMEDGACRQRYLSTASAALVEPAPRASPKIRGST